MPHPLRELTAYLPSRAISCVSSLMALFAEATSADAFGDDVIEHFKQRAEQSG